MELHDYKSATPVKKKPRKITSTAALILCLLVFIVGIVIGRANSSGKEAKAAAARIREIETAQKKEQDRSATEIETYKDEINRLKSELAAAKADKNSDKSSDSKNTSDKKTDDKTDGKTGTKTDDKTTGADSEDNSGASDGSKAENGSSDVQPADNAAADTSNTQSKAEESSES